MRMEEIRVPKRYKRGASEARERHERGTREARERSRERETEKTRHHGAPIKLLWVVR